MDQKFLNITYWRDIVCPQLIKPSFFCSTLWITQNCVGGENFRQFGITLPELRGKNYQNKENDGFQ